jgi:hypothetical protein
MEFGHRKGRLKHVMKIGGQMGNMFLILWLWLDVSLSAVGGFPNEQWYNATQSLENRSSMSYSKIITFI